MQKLSITGFPFSWLFRQMASSYTVVLIPWIRNINHQQLLKQLKHWYKLTKH
jgi:hypothetical protein